MELFPNASYFLWLEPEKAELMKMENIDAILSPLRDETADIVVPSRISKETLPAQQRAAENRANVRALDIVKNSEMRNINDFKNNEFEFDLILIIEYQYIMIPMIEQKNHILNDDLIQ